MNATATITRTLSETIDSIETSYADTFENITSTLSERAKSINDEISGRLDKIELNMPELPKKIFAYNRVAADRVVAQTRRNNDLVVDAFRPVVKMADTGVRTIVGTAKWAAEQTASTAATGVRSVIGQTQAQVKRTASTLSDQTSDLVEEAADRVVAAEKSAERVALKSMTKAELYQMAQDIDIEGRADMNKAQLITAINNAG
jgi:phage-related protein